MQSDRKTQLNCMIRSSLIRVGEYLICSFHIFIVTA